MDDKLPKLIDIYKKNEDMGENLLSIVIFRQCGYSWNDFQEFVDEVMSDEDFREVHEACIPLIKLALKDYNATKGED